MDKLTLELNRWRKLATDTSGLALVEFAYVAPLMMGVIAGGTELANYAVQSTQVSQLALQVADNASRIGAGAPLANKQITETQINDLLTGAEIHGGPLDIYGTHNEGAGPIANGRIVVSSLEWVATNKHKIAWQRCRGAAPVTYTPQYGIEGQASGLNMAGMGPAGRQVTAPSGTPVIFVEVHYRYEPLFFGGFATRQYGDINSIAAMMVRDSRDLTQIYNDENADGNPDVPPATC